MASRNSDPNIHTLKVKCVGIKDKSKDEEDLFEYTFKRGNQKFIMILDNSQTIMMGDELILKYKVKVKPRQHTIFDTTMLDLDDEGDN